MMTPAAQFLEMRDREPGDVEHGGEIDRDHLVPVIGGIIGDRQRHSGNAGIVDQHVEPAEPRDGVRHHALDFGAARHVAACAINPGISLAIASERPGIDVADKNPRAGRGKRACEFSADAGSARSNQDPLCHFLSLNVARMERGAIRERR